VVVSSYTVESQNQWTKSVSRDGNNIADDLSETIESLSGGVNIYRGVAGSLSESWNSCPDDEELSRNSSITCHGVKIVRRVMAQLLDSPRNLQLADGVQLVRIPSSVTSGTSSETTFRSLHKDNKSLLSRIQKFLSTHELRIRIPDLLPSSEDWSRLLQQFGSDKEGMSV
jgi:predicted component of type VI protein secretion system